MGRLDEFVRTLDIDAVRNHPLYLSLLVFLHPIVPGEIDSMENNIAMILAKTGCIVTHKTIIQHNPLIDMKFNG